MGSSEIGVRDDDTSRRPHTRSEPTPGRITLESAVTHTRCPTWSDADTSCLAISTGGIVDIRWLHSCVVSQRIEVAAATTDIVCLLFLADTAQTG